MGNKIKINGIYDLRTIKLLGQDYQHFGFDFYPLSLNFIQGHIFNDLMAQTFRSDFKYYLKMKNTKDFLVQSTLNEITTATKRNLIDLDNVYVEIDEKEYLSLKHLHASFWLHIDSHIDLNILEESQIKGIVIHNVHTEHAYEKERFYKFLNKIFELKNKRNLKVELALNWSENIEQSLVDFFDFDVISYPINHLVEVCYRNVNLQKLKTELNLIEKNFEQNI